MTRFERDLAAGRECAGTDLATRRANLNAVMDRAARGYTCQRRDPVCRCGEPASAHCPDCGACPHNECPAWCEPQDED